jgi:hypothetical protein
MKSTSWLGLDELACALAAAGPGSRRDLTITTAVEQGPTWTTRLLERMVQAFEPDERAEWISELKRERADPWRWSRAASEFILQRIRPN